MKSILETLVIKDLKNDIKISLETSQIVRSMKL